MKIGVNFFLNKKLFSAYKFFFQTFSIFLARWLILPLTLYPLSTQSQLCEYFMDFFEFVSQKVSFEDLLNEGINL